MVDYCYSLAVARVSEGVMEYIPQEFELLLT
jgi:hypothetical protein